jgi:GNAT superfamily N-acetyltransferase
VNVLIRRIRSDEGLRWREVRLRALQTDPLAYGSTFEGAAARSEREWMTMAAGNATSDDLATFFAIIDEHVVGLAVANRDQERKEIFDVYSVWVAPEARRQRVGTQLLAALEEWVRDRGGSALELMVSDAAPAARALYERAGFRPDGRSEPAPHAGFTEQGMTKTL